MVMFGAMLSRIYREKERVEDRNGRADRQGFG